jgi:hypothetical protein
VISLLADHAEVLDYLCRALVDGTTTGERIFDTLFEVASGYWVQLAEQGLTKPGLDPVWITLSPLTLVLGTKGRRATNAGCCVIRPWKTTTPARGRSGSPTMTEHGKAPPRRGADGARRRDGSAADAQPCAHINMLLFAQYEKGLPRHAAIA